MVKRGFLYPRTKGIQKFGLFFFLIFFGLLFHSNTNAQTAPTVSVSLSPARINPGDTVTITASVVSTSTANISYYFWWDCSNWSKDANQTGASSICGDPQDASKGASFENLSSSTKTKSISHQYPNNYEGSAGNGYLSPKIMVKQGNTYVATIGNLKVNRCLDSDGGNKPNIPGFVTWLGGTKINDVCTDNNTKVSENYCELGADGIDWNKTSTVACPSGCANGACAGAPPASPTDPPIDNLSPTSSLSVRLAGGTGGVAPYSSKNTAYATSVNNTGNYGYYFYCNRSDAGTTTGTPAPFETALAKVQSSWTMANACSYKTPGTYSPKVIVKQGTLSAENRMNITVTQPPTIITPSLALNPNPSDTTKQVTLTGTANTNNVTDSINYSFWWNCASSATTYSQAVTDCGDPTNVTTGAKFNAQSASTVSKSTQHLYPIADTYSPKVLIEQGNASAASSQSLIVNTPQFFDASLSSLASPSNSQDITLSANLHDSNTAFAKTSYTFWWNCKNSYSTVDYASIVSACGEPDSVRDGIPDAVGRRFENIWTGSQADGTAQLVNAKTALKIDYPTGQVTAIVLIERRGIAVDKKFTFNVVSAPTPSATPSPAVAPSVTASPTATASVVLPTLVVDLNLAPAQSVPGGTVTLNALTQSNTAPGTYNYYFWWNCDAPQNSTLTDIKNLCQDPSNALTGTRFLSISQSNVSQSVNHIYLNAGIYKPLIYVEHAGLNKTATSTMNVVKPTLVAGLMVNPTTADGSAKPATLTASAGGTASGSVNYTFWWDCDYEGTSIADLSSDAKCGNPLNSNKGAKYTDNSNQKVATRDYILAGTFHPKVIIERGLADPQEARSQIVINEIPVPILNVSLGAAQTSAENILPASVDITANISGNATGQTNYKIWWDCQPNTQDYSRIEGICGDPNNASRGAVVSGANNESAKTVSANYELAGLRHPFVLAERQSTQAVAQTEINIPPVVTPDTLSANLNLSSTSIKVGDTVTLTSSTQSNNSKDAYNYYFWWDCPNTDSKILSEVMASCQNPADASIGKVFINESNTTIIKNISHKYEVAGRIHPRVFIEHGTLSANSSAELLVSDVGTDETPTPTPTLTPDTLEVKLASGPDSGFNPLNDITLFASTTGSASGTINYTFYCDRSDDGTDIREGFVSKFDSVSETEKVLPEACSYDKAGTYSAKVIVERGNAPAAQSKATINVKQSAGIRLKELAIKAYPEATKPGTAIQIKTYVVDIYGNVYDDNGHMEGSNKLDGLQIFLTSPDARAGRLGSNSSSTFLETSSNLGTYPIEGSAVFEDQVLKQSVNITITNEIPVLTSVLIKARDSFMNQVVPNTNSFRIKPNGYLRLYATPLDQFGQWFANANMKYELSSSAGVIQPNGLIQAGANEGTYNDAFKAIATSSDNTVAATSNIIVTNDIDDNAVCTGANCPVPTDPTCNPCPALANKICPEKPLACIGRFCLLPACKEPNCTRKSICIGSYCLQSTCLSELTKEDCPLVTPTPTPTFTPTSSATIIAEPTATATTTSSAGPTIIPTPGVETSSTIQMVEVKIDPENPSVEKLSMKQFTASIYLDNKKIAESTVTNASAPNAQFAWTSSNVGSIDATGKFIAGDSAGIFDSAVRVNATVMINGEPRIVVGVTDVSILSKICTGSQCDICPGGKCTIGGIVIPKVIGEAINLVSSHNTNIPPVSGAVALAVLAVSAAAPLVANAGALSGLLGRTSNLFFFLPFGPRRRKNYGSVIDASTGYGIQGVIVGVINLESGKEVLRSTTDHLGRFSILVPSGKYMLNISSKDYQLAELPGYYKPRTTIEINQSAKTPVTPKIALLQSSKTLSRKLKVVSLLDSLQRIVFPLSTIALVWGTYVSYLQVPQRTKSANAILLVFYAMVWGIWVASLIKKRLRNFGVIKSGSSSVDRAVIRIFDKNNRLVSTTVSDRDGRFSVMLPKGEYIIKVVAPGMVQSGEVKAIVKEELGPLSANIQLHKA